MSYFFLLLLLPLAIPLVMKYVFHRDFTWREFSLHVAIVSLVVGAGYGLCRMNQTADTQILNGSVVSKASQHVSCEHSYRCNCYTVCSGSVKSRSCSEHCSTCYEHSYDIDWNVQTSVGRLTISRVDRRGLKEPARFTAVQIGEPASREAPFTNYVKAVPDSIFHGQVIDKTIPLPSYPRVYDYYHVNRVIAIDGGISPQFAAQLNDLLNQSLRVTGAAKQANVVVVLGTRITPAFVDALKRTWVNGKQNDVIVVAKISDNHVTFAEAFGWSKTDLVFVEIRDDLIGMADLTPQNMHDSIVRSITKDFTRLPMKEFEYLAAEIVPSPTAMAWLLALGLLLSCGLTYWFIKEDVI